jgi:hypothetical protein
MKISNLLFLFLLFLINCTEDGAIHSNNNTKTCPVKFNSILCRDYQSSALADSTVVYIEYVADGVGFSPIRDTALKQGLEKLAVDLDSIGKQTGRNIPYEHIHFNVVALNAVLYSQLEILSECKSVMWLYKDPDFPSPIVP